MKDRPVLNLYLQHYSSVFDEMTDSRRYTESGIPLPIPLSEMESYFNIHRIVSSAEREAIIRNVKVMDSTYVNWAAGKIKERTDTSTNAAVDKG